MLARTTTNSMKPKFNTMVDELIENVFENAFSHWVNPSSGIQASSVDDKLVYEIDVPGLKREELDVNVFGHRVTVTGKRRGRNIRYTANIPEGYDISSLTAKLDSGVLTLTISPIEKSSTKSRKIDIE